MGFDDPEQVAAGDKVSMETFVNKLIIVKPVEFTDKMRTEYKPDGAEAVFANIALLEPYEGEPYKVFKRVLVMQGYLVGAFKGSVGKKNPLLGTVYYGQRKSGQKPPYMFKSLTDNARAVEAAEKWMADHEDELVSSPEPAFAQPETGGASTLDSMRSSMASNPWIDEPPF